MQPRPLSNKPQRGLGGDIPDDHAPVQVELAVLALVLGVEVLRIVLPINIRMTIPKKTAMTGTSPSTVVGRR